VQQPAQAITPPHIDRFIDRVRLDWRPTIRWEQPEASVRSTTVVMIDEDFTGVLKVRRARDQQPVQTFGPHGPHEAFRDPVGLRSLHRRPNHTYALGLKHGIEPTRELAIAVANQEPNGLFPLNESPRDLPRLLRDPGLVGATAGLRPTGTPGPRPEPRAA